MLDPTEFAILKLLFLVTQETGISFEKLNNLISKACSSPHPYIPSAEKSPNGLELYLKSILSTTFTDSDLLLVDGADFNKQSIALVPNGKPIPLKDVENGSLFVHEGTIALKSEYYSESGRVDAFIVGSGEYFYGGRTKPEEVNALIVQPLSFIVRSNNEGDR